MNELLIHNAKEKLDRESKNTGSNRKALAVLPSVKKTLLDFCRQENEFAQAVIQCSKTLWECCEEIVKDSNDSISDFEVYRRAVQFYFHGADIEFQMKINLCASVEETSKIMHLSFTDLL